MLARFGSDWGVLGRRFVVVLITAITLGFAAAHMARAATYTFAGPKTWAPGWWADWTYDGGIYPYWWWVSINHKTCYCSGRVALIDGNGTWHCSTTDTQQETSCLLGSGYQFDKKPYCKNNSTSYYVAKCDVADNGP
jgi:hypothetical protein